MNIALIIITSFSLISSLILIFLLFFVSEKNNKEIIKLKNVQKDSFSKLDNEYKSIRKDISGINSKITELTTIEKME